MRKAAAVERDISDIDDDDIRVSVVGTVIRKDPIQYSMTIDDGTASITVFGDTLYEVQSTVRVIGRPQMRGEPIIDAEIIQDCSGFDLELYQRIKEMES
ncbi:MAG: replication protein RepA [Theionarchaea archaeon]|nr:replication protein RepA [Theionarchaea archaeon]